MGIIDKLMSSLKYMQELNKHVENKRDKDNGIEKPVVQNNPVMKRCGTSAFERWVRDPNNSLFFEWHGKYRDWFNNMPIDYSRIAINNETIETGMCFYTDDYFPDAPGIYKVCNGNRVRIANYSEKVDDSYKPFFWTLQIFLDQFRDANKPLPTVNTQMLYRCYKGVYAPEIEPKAPDPEVFKKLMQIMIRPLNGYEDLIDALKAYESVTGKRVLDSKEFFDDSGYVSVFTGNILDWTNSDLDEIVHEDQEVYAIYSRHYNERSYPHYTRNQIPFLRIYGVRHLYEYILNEYCDII